ncbi:uncharacterized protein LOC135496153 isoform X2 [Lineus longissimus]|uniref:uncharacterized protein LOC135496153 isoform X2 n=1 Tax=Lineus longissimus TaxID=88925 RepID=UPI00315C8442
MRGSLFQVLVFVILLELLACVCAGTLQDRLNLMWEHTDLDKDERMSRGELANIYNSFDVDHNGRIHREEFVNEWIRRTPGPGAEMQARGIFQVGDVDHNGVIAENDLADLFVQFDRRRDYTVTKREFMFMWKGIFKALAGRKRRTADFSALYK